MYTNVAVAAAWSALSQFVRSMSIRAIQATARKRAHAYTHTHTHTHTDAHLRNSHPDLNLDRYDRLYLRLETQMATHHADMLTLNTIVACQAWHCNKPYITQGEYRNMLLTHQHPMMHT
jgi:hypothetical protein